jgi:hypothetical protein
LSEPTPDFVIVGHVCQDILPDGSLGLGGAVSYAAMTAHGLGYRVGIVTSAGPDLDVAGVFPHVQVVCRPAAATTVFENIYLNGTRTQILHQRADVLTCAEVPPAWRQAPMAYLGTIDQEIAPGVFGCFSEDVLLGVMPQGFFRQWDREGHVSFCEWRPSAEQLRRIKVLVISELDVPEPQQWAQEWAQLVQVMVVTHAERGATVFCQGEVRSFPARPARQVDPTGAGDVFTAALMIRLAETGDPFPSATFAKVVASFSVETPGIAGIPERSVVDEYLFRHGAELANLR